MLIGITGGSGSGKSVVASEFENAGCKVIDCDKISRNITLPGKPALIEIEKAFGSEYIDSEGNLLRKKLGSLVFSNPDALDTLNKIINTYISRAVSKEISAENAPILCLDAPLLIEYGMDEICDVVIVVISDKENRIRRIRLRDSLSLEDAKNRINSQPDEEFYVSKADIVIYNNSTEEQFVKEIKKIINKLREML